MTRTPKLDEIAVWQWPPWAVMSRRLWIGGEYDPTVQRHDWLRELRGIPRAL